MTYRPVMQILSPYEKHFSKAAAVVCPTESPLGIMSALAPKTVDAELIAKKREELVKKDFFDRSCFDSSIPVEHRNAIMNAAADVLATNTQDVNPEPKFLRCLEKNGFGHEAGVMQALQKKSSLNPKGECAMRLACTADDDAEVGEYNEKNCLITLKLSPLPNRDDYGREFFHELSHSVPIRDGAPLSLMEECCTANKKCDVLKAFAAKRHIGEKAITIAETTDSKSAVFSGVATIYRGTDGEAMNFGAKSNAVSKAESMHLGKTTQSYTCSRSGKKICDAESTGAYLDLARYVLTCNPTISTAASQRDWSDIALALLILEAGATSPPIQEFKCSAEKDIVGAGLRQKEEIRAAISTEEEKVYVALVNKLPQTSPITWDSPPVQEHESTSLRLADHESEPARGTSIGNTPTRTIASVEPLPEVSIGKSLGSARNRDMSESRASFLVSTLEKAAAKVTKTLTPAKLELLEVDRKRIFEDDYKPKSKSPHYLVTSSATKPIQVADIGDLEGLSFTNPFANAKYAKAGAGSRIESGDSTGKVVQGAGDAKGASHDKTTTKAIASPDVSTNAFAVTQEPNVGMGSQQSSNAQPSSLSSTRAVATSDTIDFKAMDKPTLIKFITSGFRTVSPHLKDAKLREALIINKIRIYDHENQRHGSMKPEDTFIYSVDDSRLVRTRGNRDKK